MKGKTPILFVVLLLLAMIPPTLSLTLVQPDQTTTYEVTMNDTYLPANKQLTLKFVIINYNDELSLEQVIITLPYAASIDGVEAKAYNNTVQEDRYLIGTWSYETGTDTNNNPFARMYTSTLPLQTNYMLVVNLTITTTSSPGTYTTTVDLYHYLGGTQYELVDTQQFDTVIDAEPPSVTLLTEYIAKQPTETDDLYTIQIKVSDTIDGSTTGQLSEVTVEGAIAWHDANADTDRTITDFTTAFDPQTGILSITISNNTVKNSNADNAGLETGDTLTITVKAVDEAGNDGTTTVTATVDNEPPTISFVGVYYDFDNTANPPYSNEAYKDTSGTYWVKPGDSVYFVFQYSDNMYIETASIPDDATGTIVWAKTNDMSGYVAVEVTVPDGQESVSVDITIYDGAGNSASATGTASIDGAAPQIYVSYDSTNIDPNTEVRTSSTTVTLTVTADDGTAGSGVKEISYSVEMYSTYYDYANGGTSTPVSSGTLSSGDTITLDGEGVYVVTITATDNVGNSNTQTYIIINDASAPQLTDIQYQGIDSNGYSNQDSVTVTFTVTDLDIVDITIYLNETGTDNSVDEYSITVTPRSGGETVSHTFDLSQLSDGTYDIKIVAEDRSGNQFIVTETFTLDRAAPYLIADSSTLDDVNGAYLDPASDSLAGKTLVFGDDTSKFTDGIATATVLFDDTALDTAYYTVTIDTDLGTLTVEITSDAFWTDAAVSEGLHTLEVTVTDNAGNSYTYTVEFYKDAQAPVIDSYSVTDAETGVEGYTSGTVEISLQASDTVRLASEVTLQIIDPDNKVIYTDTLTLTLSDDEKTGSLTTTLDLTSIEGIQAGVKYTIKVTVKDYYGHEVTAEKYMQIDNINPVITYDGQDITGQTVELGCLTSLDSIVLEITDTGVGVETVSVTLNGEAYSDYTFQDGVLTISVSTLGDGSYTFEVTATDYAGNSAQTTITVTIDSTQPEVSIGDSTTITGGVEISSIPITDNLGVTSVEIVVNVNGQDYVMTGLNPSIFESGMYVITTEGVFPADSFSQLQYMIGEHYATMANPDDPVDYPVLVLIDGKVYLIPGLYSEDVTASITVKAYDCAGNEGTATAEFTIPAGQFVLFELYQGWNLVSLPVMADNLKTSDFVNWIEGDGNVVIYIYDKANGTWKDPYIPGVSANDYNLKDGMAFWVYYESSTGGEAIVVAQGYLPYTTPPSGTPPGFVEYYLTEGGNFLGFTSAAPLPISYYLSYLIDTDMIYEWVYIYNPATQSWGVVSVQTNGDRLLYPGQGMWVIVFQDTPFNVLPWYSWYNQPT